ncbi:MAG: hypothetical protein R3B47_09335 [Bacteroidia bacterium]
MNKILALLLCLLLAATSLNAQISLRDSAGKVNMIHVTYRPLLPLGSWGDRYGILNSLGFEFSHKFSSNLIIDAGANLIVDGEVKVSESFDVLSDLRINGGFIISDDGTPVIVRQRAEGFLFPVSVGKVFPSIGGTNPNNGLYVKLGAQ